MLATDPAPWAAASSLVLTDSQKRAIFDVYGAKGLTAGSEVRCLFSCPLPGLASSTCLACALHGCPAAALAL